MFKFFPTWRGIIFNIAKRRETCFFVQWWQIYAIISKSAKFYVISVINNINSPLQRWILTKINLVIHKMQHPSCVPIPIYRVYCTRSMWGGGEGVTSQSSFAYDWPSPQMRGNCDVTPSPPIPAELSNIPYCRRTPCSRRRYTQRTYKLNW